MKCLIILGLFNSISLYAQELGEISVEFVPEGEGITFIVRDPNESILVVHSSIPVLSFESNNIIISVDNPDPGEYRLHLQPGTHIITFKAEGYMPVKERYYLPKKEYKEVRVMITKKIILEGKLVIKATTDMAEVYIDGVLSGTTPFKGTFERGSYEITMKKNMFHDFVQTIQVVGDTTMTYYFDLLPQFGSLSLSSEPLEAEVFLNGNLRGLTPIQIDTIPSGDYSLLIRKVPYEDVRRTVSIKDGDKLVDNIILPKTEEAIALENKQIWSKRRNWTLVGSGVFAITGLGLKFLADSKFEEYNKATSTDSAVNLRKQVENIDLYTVIAYASSGLFAGWSVYNQLKIPKIDEDISSQED